jgi:hypothetical protein
MFDLAMMKPTTENLIKIGLAILILICLFELPYGSYQLFRFLFVVAFAILASQLLGLGFGLIPAINDTLKTHVHRRSVIIVQAPGLSQRATDYQVNTPETSGNTVFFVSSDDSPYI